MVARPPPVEWRSIDISDLIATRAKLAADGDFIFNQVHGVWAEHAATLKVVFKFFCLQSASPSPHEMGYDAVTRTMDSHMGTASCTLQLVLSPAPIVCCPD